MRLLSTSPKIEKSNKAGLGYLSTIMYLAPARLSGYNVCQYASAGCALGCLHTSGFGGIYKSVGESRIARTKLFFENRPEFEKKLRIELDKFIKKCKKLGLLPVVRLNGLSDLPFDKIFPTLFSDYSQVIFYDYTKNYSRMVEFLEGKLATNYHLTFSRSETNQEQCKNVLLLGGNVAVVFKHKTLPKTWMGFPVNNADETDLRFLDKKGVSGLYAKGRARKDTSGFVVKNKDLSKKSPKKVKVAA